MRLAYEGGLVYVVEDLEEKREAVSAQLAYALQYDRPGRRPSPTGSGS